MRVSVPHALLSAPTFPTQADLSAVRRRRRGRQRHAGQQRSGQGKQHCQCWGPSWCCSCLQLWVVSVSRTHSRCKLVHPANPVDCLRRSWALSASCASCQVSGACVVLHRWMERWHTGWFACNACILSMPGVQHVVLQHHASLAIMSKILLSPNLPPQASQCASRPPSCAPSRSKCRGRLLVEACCGATMLAHP